MTIDAATLAHRLAALERDFEGAPDAPSGFQQALPDGTYEGSVKSFDFFESKDGTSTFLKTVLVVENNAPLDGREAEAVSNLTDPARFSWLKKHLNAMGAEQVKPGYGLKDLLPGSDLLDGLLDIKVEFAVKRSTKTDADGNPFVNVYVNRKLAGPSSDIPGDAAEFKQTRTGGAYGSPSAEIPF